MSENIVWSSAHRIISHKLDFQTLTLISSATSVTVLCHLICFCDPDPFLYALLFATKPCTVLPYFKKTYFRGLVEVIYSGWNHKCFCSPTNISLVFQKSHTFKDFFPSTPQRTWFYWHELMFSNEYRSLITEWVDNTHPNSYSALAHPTDFYNSP